MYFLSFASQGIRFSFNLLRFLLLAIISLLLNPFSLLFSGVDVKVSGGTMGQTSPLGRLRSRTVTGNHTANNAQQIEGGLYRAQ